MGLREWWRARREPVEFPEQWRSVLESCLAPWPQLSDDERDRLEQLTLALIYGKRWEGTAGVTVTDEMKVVIAGHAALLVLELGIGAYDRVGSILVAPKEVRVEGREFSFVPGLVSDGPVTLSGETSLRGPVMITWNSVTREARHPDRGHNVVFHEFAHKLDLLDGVVDGTPPLSDPAVAERWVSVFTAEYEAVGRGEGSHLLRSYASVNAGEFFAVVTEVFFTRGAELAADRPELYELLRGFYRQDPAERSRSPR
ncbi:MAG: M90 family metallopeptidase [Microthrixaceae bacterium]